MPPLPAREKYITASEVAALLHVSPKTVTRWAKTGKLGHLRTLGGHRRYREADIRQLIDDSTEPVRVR